MNNKSVLICHHAPSAGDALASLLRRVIPQINILVAADLTEAYDMIEHRLPSVVVTSKDLAKMADYDGFQALLRQVGVTHLNWQADRQRLSLENRTGTDETAHAFSISGITDFIDPPAGVALSPRNRHQNSSSPKGSASRAILIGASTGGVDAICKVIQGFGPASPPTLIVQHTSGQFAKSLARLLDGATQAKVVLAEDAQRLQSGMIYLSPGDGHHLLLSGAKRPKIALGSDGLISGHRPSVDALFRSAVPHARDVAAALLTGMGRDGAEGLKALKMAGAHTIAQDEATSVVYGMPRIAAEIGAVTRQLPLDKIGPALLDACHVRAGT